MKTKLFAPFLVVVILIYGCASTGTAPETHFIENSDYPLGIVIPQYPPQAGVDFRVRGKANGTAAGAAAGAKFCTVLLSSGGSADPGASAVLAASFLLCLPIGPTIGAVGGAITTESADVAQLAEVRIHKQLRPLLGQEKFAEIVKEHLSDGQENVGISVIDGIKGAKSEDTEIVFERTDLGKYQTVLEVALLEIYFKSSGKRNAPLCLKMKARATKWDGNTGAKMDTIETVYDGDCALLDKWIEEKGNKIISDIEYGYQIMAEDIV